MLRVEYGPFPSLENAFISRLRELKARDPLAPAAVVAPSRRMADRLERLIAVERGSPMLGVHVHTFHSLAVGVLEAAGFPDRRLIGDSLFHDRLIDGLLNRRSDLARRFGGRGRTKALSSALRATLRDLIDAGVEAEEMLGRMGEDWPQDSAAAGKLQDLLELQRAVQAWGEDQGLWSPSGMIAAAADAAEDSFFLSGFKEILYYGFYDLTGLQLSFFERVTSSYPSVLYFPYRKGHPAWRFCDEFFELKLHRGAAAPQALDSGSAGPLDPALDALFSPDRSAEIASGALRIYSSSGARDEAWSVSKEIVRLAEDEGIGFDEIGVVARTLEPYRAAVADVFEADGVPFEMGEGEPLKRHPIARMAVDLWTLLRMDFPSAAVSDLVQSPYFKRDGSGRVPLGWRHLIDGLGISAGWLAWEAKLERLAGEAETASDARGLLNLLKDLRDELAPPASLRPWSGWAAHARGLLERRLRLPKDASRAESAAWAAVLSATEALASFDPLGDVAWDFFLDTLLEKLEAVRLEGPSRRGVRVMSAMDARGESFRVLFLIGLQEGIFPRQVREDPLLPDETRGRLQHPGGYWIGRKGSGHEEERLLFALCASAVRERLYCVYSRSDEDGRAVTPSWYLRELCRAARVRLADAERVPRQPWARLASRPPEHLPPQEIALRLAQVGRDPSDFLSAALGETRCLTVDHERIFRLNAGGRAGPFDGIVGPQQKILQRFLRRGVSPSALDTLGTCSFKFFAAHFLGLKEGDEMEQGDLSAPLRGRLYHKVLERFYRALTGAGYWNHPGSVDWEASLSRAIQETFAQRDWKEVGVYPLVWQAARLNMEAQLRRFIRWDMERIAATGFVPSVFEAELRGTLPLKEENIPGVKSEGLEFHGKADRIDLDAEEGRYQVVDYKTRRKKPGLNLRVYSGKSHQSPVYAELARSVLDPRIRWRLGGAPEYVLEPPQGDDAERVQDYSGEQWERDKEAVLGSIAAYLGEIAEGRFPIQPDNDEFGGHCRQCAFSSMCRKSHGRSRRRAEALYQDSILKRIHDRRRSAD